MLTLDRATFDLAHRDAPDWVRADRAEALQRYETLPMPGPTDEVWRYVELDFDVADFGLAAAPGRPLPPDGTLAALGEVAGHAMIIDGFTVAIESGASGRAVFTSLARAASEHEPELRPALGVDGMLGRDKFGALHGAFQRDGVFLHVPGGHAVPAPFFVDVHAATDGVVSLPRLTVSLGADAEAEIVLRFRSPHDVAPLAVPRTEAIIGDGSRLRLTTLQEWGRSTRSVAQQHLRVGRDAAVTFGEVGLGGALSRLHLAVDLAGRGSSANVVGAYFGDRTQILDYRYFMTHAAPNTTSDMFLKGAVEDEAESVFTGLIRIEEEAQRTNAFQTNRNLVLSEGAIANSVPNLEILANDVRCGHGSTMGPLDEEQRYYLMSRGLDRIRADRLQVRGFFEEAIRKLPAVALADLVRERVNAKFIAAQEEGRV